MIPAFPARKRAEEFDRMVAASAAPDRRTSKTTDDLRDLAVFASSLSAVGDSAHPGRDFSASLRERLMVAAETELVPAPRTEKTLERKLTVNHVRKPRRQRKLTVAIAAMAIVGGTAGAATASQTALPGDSLYPVKRAVENVSAGFTVSTHARGVRVLEDAGTRLREAKTLVADAPLTDADRVTSTLEAFSTQAAHGSDLLISDFGRTQNNQSLAQLRTFAADGVEELAELSSKAPERAEPAVSDAAQTLVLIDQAAAQLCPTCEGGINELPSTLVSSLTSDIDGMLPADTVAEAEALPPPARSDSALDLPSIDPDKIGPGSVTDPDGKKDDDKSGEPDDGASEDGGILPPSVTPDPSEDPSDDPSDDPAPEGPVTGLVTGVTGLVGDVVAGATGLLKPKTKPSL
ncbi:hypothetical protein FB381_4606 [Nocardioides albertanoniae]|uniref:DUF5667 domain-containing protein n=1 Tax=Nocardioides albertanoniae TaxID=1175486 RepID=A0A543ADK4_9ACTN|nr:DUF5667 domain-containing protein [Nocardioides albertanoniae]TQL70667.1 hypothetical protein FB381_4606 [Nocardioides albertanoniae]